MAIDEELDRKNRAVVQQSWAELNPYNNIEPTHPKSLIDILDDFFVNCVDKYPDLFLVKCGALGKLTRCREGVYEREADVLPPPLDIAKAKNIVNTEREFEIVPTAKEHQEKPVKSKYHCFPSK